MSTEVENSNGTRRKLIGAIDQGTTSTRFFLYDEKLHVVGSHQMEFTQIHPQAGWVEHDPMEILHTVRECMGRAIAMATISRALSAAAGDADPSADIREGDRGSDVRLVDRPSEAGAVQAVGLTNQRETTVVWRRSTGEPLYNAIVWMDARTTQICRRLERQLSGGRDHLRSITGLPISTYFSAVKLIWLLENVPAVREAADAGDALFGTVDTWIIWNMTGGRHSPDTALHVTDCTNASRTLLMDLRALEWHGPTLEELRIPRSMLPDRIISNAEVIAPIAPGWPLAGVPLAGCLGDQHAAMLGQRCGARQGKATLGTGCFILLNTGEQLLCPSAHGLLSTPAFQLGAGKPVTYALEGSIAIAGAAVQWLRDSLGIISRTAEVEALARQVDSTGGVYFVPAFSGLFAPRWREDARGVIVGISRYTTKAHIARAVLESICFQVREVLAAMHSDAGSGMDSQAEFVLRVDGGAAANDLLLQLQADLLGCPVVRPRSVETTALGAALAAGLAVGLWDQDSVFEAESSGPGEVLGQAKTFQPQCSEEDRQARCQSWCKAVERSYGLADLA